MRASGVFKSWALRILGIHPYNVADITPHIRKLLMENELSEWQLQAIAGDCFAKLIGKRLAGCGEPPISVFYSVVNKGHGSD